MSDASFDAAAYASFNLADGLIATNQEPSMVLLPNHFIEAMAPTPMLRKNCRAFGQKMGQSLADELAHTPDMGLTKLVGQLRSAIALMGLGRLSIETRGDALLFRIQQSTPSATGKTILEQFVAGYLSTLSASDFDCTAISTNNEETILLAGNEPFVADIRGRVENGRTAEEILAALVEYKELP